MSKGEEEQATGERAGKQRKCMYCHQCQRGRLLEILSLMAKEVADAETRTVTRRLRQTMEQRGNEEKGRDRGRKYGDRVVSTTVEAEVE